MLLEDAAGLHTALSGSRAAPEHHRDPKAPTWRVLWGTGWQLEQSSKVCTFEGCSFLACCQPSSQAAFGESWGCPWRWWELGTNPGGCICGLEGQEAVEAGEAPRGTLNWGPPSWVWDSCKSPFLTALVLGRSCAMELPWIFNGSLGLGLFPSHRKGAGEPSL